ncbi:MAG: hypothetical protein R2715_11845 [Ilumatobacteraceae bacterium]
MEHRGAEVERGAVVLDQRQGGRQVSGEFLVHRCVDGGGQVAARKRVEQTGHLLRLRYLASRALRRDRRSAHVVPG